MSQTVLPNANGSHSEAVAPTINVAPYLKDPQSAAGREVVDNIRRACIETGFFQLVGHNVTPETQEAAFRGAERFFSLPLDDKRKLDTKTTKGHRGYDLMGVQSYSDDLKPDLKECFYMGQHNPESDPRVQAGRFFMGPNVWPSSSVLADAEFKVPAQRYYEAVSQLMLVVLEIIGHGLPKAPQAFKEFVNGDYAAPMRMLHYPPQPIPDEKQLGASAHTDFGALTLLLQDDHPGLQVLDPKTDKWVTVPPQKGAYVVNVGDMLSMWTNNLYKSCTHRVINAGNDHRYSIVYFLDGNLDCRLDPLDGSAPASGKAPTVEQHMLNRMAASFGKSEDSVKYKSKS